MWQLALAAALAGSSFFATRFLTSNNADPDQENGKRSNLYDESGFEFSSPGDGKKKGGNGYVGKWGKVEGIGGKCGWGRVLEGKRSRKGFGVCLKKRKVSKFGPGKCDSCSSSSKGNPVFSRGIGVGIMCMMSAGKAEISKLNAAMDETAKVVYELKSELLKRKASHSQRVSSSKLEINTDLEEPRAKNSASLQSNAEFNCNVQDDNMNLSGECERSIVTEEPQGEATEMDLLEAELELELQKLSWSPSNASVPEERRHDFYEHDVSTEGIYEQESELSTSFLSNGVAASVLNHKLSKLLIKQQEEQIVELESELHQAQSKLEKREAELQKLEECVRRMTQFTIANASDEEHVERKSSAVQSKRPKVGLKRAMSFGSYSCHITPQSI